MTSPRGGRGPDAPPRTTTQQSPPAPLRDPWDEATARHHLQRTWYPFFAPFGRLTPTQRRALPAVYAGANVVLMAPTASGKTEAIVAPLLERIVAQEPRPNGVRLLAVAPTRALAHDLAGRLEAPLGRLGLEAAVRTGDRKTLRTRDRQAVLVTTPESLDSLLCRTPEVLDALRAVFVDELHFIANAARGDQLAVLLRRLEARAIRAGHTLQRCGASASLDSVDAVATEFLGRDCERVSLPPGEARARPIEAEWVYTPSLAAVEAALRERIAADPRRRRIVFVNRRADAEELGDRLRGVRAVVHHGSLSTGERERAETALRSQPGALCICTSTLEVGIDIGAIDEAVLVGPPPDVASLVQRAGRASRRAQTIRAVFAWASESDRVRFEVLAACAEAGRMHDEVLPPRPAVLAQQLVSAAFEKGLAPVDAPLAVRLAGPGEIDEAGARRLLESLREADLLHGDAHGRYVPSEAATTLHTRGSLHSNLAPTSEVPAIDALTNRVIGRVDPARVRAAGPMAFGGATRRVVRETDRAVYLTSAEGSAPGAFVSRDAPRLSFGLARALGEAAGLAADEIGIELDGYGSTLHHWAGTLWGVLLWGVARERRWRPRGKAAGGSVALSLDARFADPPARLVKPGTGGPVARAAVDDAYPYLVRALAPGPFARHVPPALERAWVERAVRLDAFIAWIEEVRLVDVSPTHSDAAIDGGSLDF